MIGQGPAYFEAAEEMSDTENMLAVLDYFHNSCKVDNFVKSRIFPFFWIPAFAGMTIIQLISDRYHRRHTREGGYPVFKTIFYDSIKVNSWTFLAV